MSVKLSSAALARSAVGRQRSELPALRSQRGHRSYRRRQFSPRASGGLSGRSLQRWNRSRLGASSARACARPDIAMREKLAEQDWLTTVVEQEAHTTSVRVTGAMVDFIKPFDVTAVLDMLARPAIRIVSLTVTEGGYYISPATQQFDPAHPDIVDDARHIGGPKTAFGLIVAGLKRRRSAGVAPFTVMSCDNIPGNGHVTENAVAGLAELADPELARWIRTNVAFPNSMVDRITPGHDRPRARDPARHLRRRGQLAGVLRRVPPVGGRRQIPRWPAGAREGRRHIHLRRRALRADEDPHPQWRTCGDRLSGRTARHPFRPRGDGGCADRRLPRRR